MLKKSIEIFFLELLLNCTLKNYIFVLLLILFNPLVCENVRIYSSKKMYRKRKLFVDTNELFFFILFLLYCEHFTINCYSFVDVFFFIFVFIFFSRVQKNYFIFLL